MFHRHRSFFPLVLALLTILLIALMVWELQPKAAPTPEPAPEPAPEEEASPITMEEYQSELSNLLRDFFARYDAADQDFLRVIAADEALGALLDFKVPTQYKDLHLAVAVNLNLIRRGLAGDPDLLQTGLDNFQDLRQVYPWLP